MVAKSIAKMYTNIHKPTDYIRHRMSQGRNPFYRVLLSGNYPVIVVSIYNLTVGHGDSTLWTALQST